MNGISVGGMDRQQLTEMINAKNQELSEGRLVLQHGTIKEEWGFKELNVHVDQSKLDELLAMGRSGNVMNDWIVRWRALLFGGADHAGILYDKNTAKNKVAELVKKYSADPVDAMPVFKNDGSVSFTEGVPYLKIDEAKLADAVDHAISHAGESMVEIPVTEEKLPNLTAEQVRNFNTVLGQYSTNFGGNPNRSRNIELASSAISGTIVGPGESFSYNHATGMRSPDKGYMEAPVIVNGRPEPGYGGGVCQVSTTLFNAVMLSGLQVTERTPHFSPASYAPIGQDATVSYGDLDFCFVNTLKHPVYVYSVYAPGEITCYIIGAAEDKPEVAEVLLRHSGTIGFDTVEKIDPSIEEEKNIEYGHEGYTAGIMQYAKWADGRIYEDTFESYYDPVNTVVTYKTDPKKAEAAKKAKEKQDKAGKNVKQKEVKSTPKSVNKQDNTPAKIIPLGNG